MTRRAFLVVCAAMLLAAAAAPLAAQRHATVPVDAPVYRLLESAEMRGIVSRLPRAKPYSERRIAGYLEAIWADRGALSAAEREVLSEYRGRYSAEPDAPVSFSVTGGAEGRADLAAIQDAHFFSTIGAEAMGDIGRHFSYKTGFLYHLQRINGNAWAPFDFTKQWDGIRIGVENFEHDREIDEVNDFVSLSHSIRPDAAVSLFDGNAEIRWAKVRRSWGHGEGSLELSAQARPADGISIFASPADWVYFDYLTASLGDWTTAEPDENPDTPSDHKMLTIHQVELYPFDWLSLSVFESVIWGKRFELSYLNPLSVYIVSQHQIGDIDNLLPGAATKVRLAPWGNWYTSVFVDSIRHDDFAGIFDNVINMFAYQSGIKVNLPWLPFATATLQYTKIEPYMYAHYPQEYSFFDRPVDSSYTHDGENLGFHLPPNSDEIFLGVTTLPRPGLRLGVSYQLIRHGDNPDAPDPGEDADDRQIEGDIDDYLVYRDRDKYPNKNFLNDGIYEWVNIASVRGDYRLPDTGFSLWSEYSFSYALNWLNERDNTMVRNALGLGFEYSYDFSLRGGGD